MKTYTECIPCFVRQAHDALQQVVDDEELEHRTLQCVLLEAAHFPLEQTPPVGTWVILEYKGDGR